MLAKNQLFLQFVPAFYNLNNPFAENGMPYM